jgi:tetratricopeptide (TPR) repeat protein
VLPFDQEWLYATSLLAEVYAVVGDESAAGELYGLLEPWAALNAADPGEGMRGSVARYLGLLATSLGRFDEAERHFDAGLAMNEHMGARPWLAHTQFDYARMLLAREAAGDHERALSLAASALATYRELGMAPWVDRAEALEAS